MKRCNAVFFFSSEGAGIFRLSEVGDRWSDVLLRKELQLYVDGRVHSLDEVRASIKDQVGAIVPLSVLRAKLKLFVSYLIIFQA